MNSKYTTVCNAPIPTSATFKPPLSNPSYTSPLLPATYDERDYTLEGPPSAPRSPERPPPPRPSPPRPLRRARLYPRRPTVSPEVPRTAGPQVDKMCATSDRRRVDDGQPGTRPRSHPRRDGPPQPRRLRARFA